MEPDRVLKGSKRWGWESPIGVRPLRGRLRRGMPVPPGRTFRFAEEPTGGYRSLIPPGSFLGPGALAGSSLGPGALAGIIPGAGRLAGMILWCRAPWRIIYEAGPLVPRRRGREGMIPKGSKRVAGG